MVFKSSYVDKQRLDVGTEATHFNYVIILLDILSNDCNCVPSGVVVIAAMCFTLRKGSFPKKYPFLCILGVFTSPS